MRRLVDLSHPVVSGEVGYPGLPAPRIEAHVTHAASAAAYGGRASFEISRIWMVGGTGTYLDAPAHRHAGAADLAELPLASLAGLPARRIDATWDADRRIVIDPEVDSGLAGAAVLIRTGWDARRGTAAYWRPAPFVDASLARRLVAAGVALVGVDTWNVDDPADPERPAHTLLLAAAIPIVEHLRGLDGIPALGAHFSAVPAPIRGATSLPVRAFAEIATST